MTIKTFEKAFHGVSEEGETATEARKRIGSEVVKLLDAQNYEPGSRAVTVDIYERNGRYEFWYSVAEND